MNTWVQFWSKFLLKREIILNESIPETDLHFDSFTSGLGESIHETNENSLIPIGDTNVNHVSHINPDL